MEPRIGEAASLRDKSLGVEADLQAFDYARSRAGDVTELFDILAAKLRPGSKSPNGGSREGGKTKSGKSTLQAHYHGSSGNTVLSTANLKRIQTFLDEPQKHLGQVFADIEKEAGEFYNQVSSIRQPQGAGVQRMQRGAPQTRLMGSKETCLEDVPEMNKDLGPSSRFGDGDGSFWDRWLTTTGHFSEQGKYANADMPTHSMYSKGSVIPHSGFKRYQLDKLAFLKNPDPRVLTYAERRELGHEPGDTDAPKRLRGATSEKCLSPATREWLDEAVLSNASTTEQNVARKNKNRDEHNANKEEGGAFNTSKSAPSLPGRFGSRAEGVRRVETSGRAGGDEQEPSVLATLREKIRTIGAYGERGTISGRSVTWSTAMREEAEQEQASQNQSPSGKTETATSIGHGEEEAVGAMGRENQSMERTVAGLGLVHPNYFGRRARTHVYDYYKQVSRRRHQYGDQTTMTAIPLSPVAHVGIIPAYKAGVDAVQSSMEEVFGSRAHDSAQANKRTKKAHLLPPLGRPAAGGKGDGGSGEGVRGGLAGAGLDGEGETKEGTDRSKRLEEAGSFSQVTSRTRYLMRCMEQGVAPRAHIIIRKTHTTKVNLAHQGMGDVMGSILADCLAGLPLMRELNLRDNRLTDKGLIPIVKAIKQRHDLNSLDLSENKLDRWAARELALYFADPLCTLAKFVLSKADVDDFEAANLVKNMRMNKTLTYLDISYNLIGTQESINYVRPEFYTGAEALADWISTESCALTHLDISWNTIRLDSAVYFGKALAHATKLVELDLGFNCFGPKGGEAIGASLHVNTSLKTLGLESNAINPRACFVICQGLLCNSTMRRINLSNNALGKVGVGCVMALTAEIGDRMKANMSHCNFMVGCEECWFDDTQLQPSYVLKLEEPYDRAVAVHLVRRAARDEGLKLKVVAHTAVGEAERVLDLVTGTGQPERPLADYCFQEEIFRKYDKDASGSLNSAELVEALSDLEVAGGNQVDLIMSRHGDGNDRIEETEFHDFVQRSMLQSRKREDRSKAFIADASKPAVRWVIPSEGKLRIDLDYQRLHHQGCHTSSESTDGMLAMLSGIGDGLAEVMAHALDFVSLDVEQGVKTYMTIVKHMGGDKIKALAKVIPRMESPSDARLLKNTILRDLDERRKLMLELGPAYRPLMGTPMGRYELDMAKPMHQLAARKILEYNNSEKFARQTGSPLVFDASQKGNWENVRNECINGKPFRFNCDILEPPPSAGLLELDYVSTTSRADAGGGVAQRHQVPMSVRRFQGLVRQVGLGQDQNWANAAENDFEQAIDEALLERPPRPRSHALFEHLHFLYTGEGSPGGEKAPIPSRPSAMDKRSSSGGHKQPGHSSPPRSGTSSETTDVGTLHAGSNPLGWPRPGVTTLLTTGAGMHLEATVRLNAMAFRLEELMADRWFSIRQCRFVVLTIQEAFQGDDFLQDVLVEFVVTVYPRIVDVYDYSALVACLEERSQAFVIKRVGWLAVWNACRPDGYIELAFDRREERQVAKMLVHLASQEPSENWTASSFRWAMYDQPTPGWLLPAALFTEAGMPHKGILTCTYTSRPGGLHNDWVLRMALTQAVSLCEPPPVTALGITEDAGCSIDTGATGSNTGSSGGGVEELAGGGQERLAAGPGLEALEGSFDREFVDALCRQMGKGFFFYGTNLKQANE